MMSFISRVPPFQKDIIYLGGASTYQFQDHAEQLSLIKLCVDSRIPGKNKAKMLDNRYSSNLLRM